MQSLNLCATAATVLPLSQDPLALSLNENPFPPLPTVRTAIVEATASINRYPEFLPQQLRTLIAQQLGLSTAQIVIGAGATGVVMEILRVLTRPGERIVMAFPTFDGYPIFAQIAGLVPVQVPLDDCGHHDLNAMADAAGDARVVVLCRPHNPTGTAHDERDIRRFLSRIAPDTVVLLDEAYVEFLAPPLQLNVEMLVRDFPNVVVVRTFSKAYGLAGLRIGYGFCAADIARQIWATHPPFGSSFISLAAIEASFRAETELRKRITAITVERTFLRIQLRALGLWTAESHANFVYLPNQGHSWAAVFDAAGIRVRPVGKQGVRITVGDRSSTRAVLAAVKPATRVAL
ncbi:MAG: aminotransferase class I/II-fold pyridoxal phosphate-dependent enzyme [Mycobacterium sp.]